MYKSARKKRFLLVGNVKQVLENRNQKLKHTFTYLPNGDSYYLVDGKKVGVKEFNEMFPVDFKPPITKGANYDRTKNWVHGDKSY